MRGFSSEFEDQKNTASRNGRSEDEDMRNNDEAVIDNYL
jgi:hypothetical protein